MKVLFIGLGGIGQRHLRNIKHKYPESEIYAIRKRNENYVLTDNLEISKGEDLEQKYQIKCLHSLEEAVENHIEYVFICNPTSLHMPYLLKALELGFHVFVEKPLSDSAEYNGKLLSSLKETKSTTMIGYQNRFHPCIKKAKQILAHGNLGKICSVNVEIGENVTGWHKYEDYRRMYACRKDLGGGVILSQIHELDYLYYFFGIPASVYALGGKLSELEIDVEDSVDILMNYHYKSDTFPVHIHEDYLQKPPARWCKIVGTSGCMIFDLLDAKLRLYDSQGELIIDESYNFVRNDMFVEEVTDFLESAAARKESAIPISEGIKSLCIALAVKDSIENKQIIEISAYR